MTNTPSDRGPAVETPRRPRGQADCSPQTHSSPTTLATGSESVNRQECQTRGSGGCPSWWRTSYLVPSNGHDSEENGKPRRKVDMQVLNKHAVRETHYTQSPFHQATLVTSGTKKTITDA